MKQIYEEYEIVVVLLSLLIAVVAAMAFYAAYLVRCRRQMSYRDSLTGLPNRQRLAKHFEQTFAGYREGYLMIIDFDRFKAINDMLGHDMGDLFIQQAARRLAQAASAGQQLFRFGGDEFLIVAEGGRAAAEALAAALLASLKQPFQLHDSEFMMTASIGISLSPQHGSDRTSLLKAADIAMYASKSAGRNRHSVYDEETKLAINRRHELERGLRKAMQLNELAIHYQPKWDADAGRLTGIEALLRWNHGKLGPVSPSEFIPISEENGMIVAITRWMMYEVCKQNRTWQAEGLPKVCVSVNMSIRVFESGMLGTMVREALADSGMDPSDLELEITESIAMRDIEGTIVQLREVKALGVRVSMDDFGTGYSSLGNLDRIPIDTLKIDQLFIQQSQVPSKQAIISTIIAMARHLQLDIVAEGVETEEQILFLQSRGCRVMQGYFYGKPMHAVALREWMLAV
ncbi:putative bifunctional diguanylate cyclase/phosphodiesterase [Paenibacillus darwinianus]|uniref:putative bifunctional diguanylate cyclase/phosphodiesterase n=1 Tax=Paenibacillus darwinianus TaxID=1380763 RepID=UPI000691D557|nr:EAL domain-containing protein [Paenibacillus darwinianus]